MIAVKRDWALVAIVACCLTMAVTSAIAAEDNEPVDFGRDIQPILSDRCFACHGPDAGKREAELRLDLRESALKSEAILPGKPAESSLIERITSDDPDLHMPPADSEKKQLTLQEIELLRRWIAQGAKYTDHWSYAKPVRPPVPTIKKVGWAENSIDYFIAAEYERRGLKPSIRANRRKLMRRLSFDLTGLPPKPKDVAAFEADRSENAYEKLVSRLLQSPHFGERIAMYWLDLVRFADTNGYHSDIFRDLSAYRDYVINAFNNNKPFDQFTIEQLAGDLLPESGNEQKIASGYNRLLQTTEEGGAQRKEYLAIYQADRVRNVSTVWLGTTLGCCQCHDHKFDPFTMRDFYSMGAFFADLSENVPGRQPPNLRLPTSEETAEIAKLTRDIKAAETAPIPDADIQTWATELKEKLDAGRREWKVISPVKVASSGGATLASLDDQSVLASGENPVKDDYTITLSTDLKNITGIRLEALTHPSLSGGGLSRGNGNFVLTDFAVNVAANKDATPKAVKIAAATADFEQPNFAVKLAIDDNRESGWAVSGQTRKENNTAVFTFAKPLAGGTQSILTVHLHHQSAHGQHNIGRFRLSLTTAEKPGIVPGVNLSAAVIAALDIPAPKRSDAQNKALTAHYRAAAPALEERRKQIAAWKKQSDKTNKGIQTMLVSQAVKPREIRILARGNWQDDSGEIVTPNSPAFLPPLGVTDQRATRLDLARWMVSRDNPLTARVFVNRLWCLLYGNGLSSSLEDAGHQGNRPSHPELLDWLAVEFMESGWDVKHIIRLIVASQTYQQDSRASAEERQRDPSNQWLTRQNQFRLDAELIRDNALSVSGLLVRSIRSRRSVKPYQPAGFWRHMNFPARTYQADNGENQYRRGLYTYWCRSFPHPSLTTFDAPSREECTAQRPRSNTPLQALVLLNDPIYVETSRALAQRLMETSPQQPAAGIRWIYRQVLSREPTKGELQIVRRVYTQEQARFKNAPEAADKLVHVGQLPVPEKIDTVELAAWTEVARVILNLHETITRQ